MSFIDMDFYSKPLVDGKSISFDGNDQLEVNVGEGLEITTDLHIKDGSIDLDMLGDMGATKDGQILKYVIPAGETDGAWTVADAADVSVDGKSIVKDDTTGEISVNTGDGLKIDDDNGLEIDYNTDDLKIDDNNKLTHANVITEQTTEEFATFKYDKNGHITGATEITFDDDLELTTANKLKHKTEITAQTEKKPVNVKIDKYGHITEYEDTNIEDLANVDEDTTPAEGNVLVYKNVGTTAAPVMKWSPEDAAVKIDEVTIQKNSDEEIEVSIVADNGLKAVTTGTDKGIAVDFDDSTIGINATSKKLEVKDEGITKEKLNEDVANGDKGLKLDSTTGLEIKIDDSTIDFITTTGDNKGKLEVKDTGVTKAKLNEDVIKTNGGLDFNNTDGLSVKINEENLNIPTTGDDAGKLEIKDKGVTDTKIKADTTAKQVLLTDTASTSATPQSAVWGKITPDYLEDGTEDYVITTVEDDTTPVWGQVRTGGIADKAVTYEKIDDTDADDGEVLKYTKAEGATEGSWAPAKLSENIDSDLAAGNDMLTITNDAFKVSGISFRFQFEPNAAATGGKSEQLILKRYTLDDATGVMTLYFDKKATAKTKIRVVVNY